MAKELAMYRGAFRVNRASFNGLESEVVHVGFKLSDVAGFCALSIANTIQLFVTVLRDDHTCRDQHKHRC